MTCFLVVFASQTNFTKFFFRSSVQIVRNFDVIFYM